MLSRSKLIALVHALAAPRVRTDLAATLTLAICALALTAWSIGRPAWAGWLPGSPVLVPNAALGYTALALALLALVRERPRIARWLAAGAAAVGAATVLQYFPGWPWCIDELVLADRSHWASGAPGRMSPHTASALIFAGTALTLAAPRQRGQPTLALVIIASLPLTMAMLGLVGHLTDLSNELSFGHHGVSAPAAWCILAIMAGTHAAWRHRCKTSLVLQHAPIAFFAIATIVLLLVGAAGWRNQLELSTTHRAIAETSGRIFSAAETGPAEVGPTLADLRQELEMLTARQANAAAAARSLTLAGVLFAIFTAGAAVTLHHRIDHRRRRAELETRENAERFRMTFDDAGIGMAIVSLAGTFQRVNGRLCAILGYTPEELAQRSGEAITHAEDRPADQRHVQELLAGARNHSQLEKRYLHRDGSVRWVRQTSSLVHDAAGRPLYFVTQFEDVSERRKAEQALEASFRRINDLQTALDEHAIVSVADRFGRITYVNDNFVRISGYTREELIGRDHRIINSGHHPVEFMRDLWQTVRQGQVWRGEMKNRAKDGRCYWVESVIVPFRDEVGEPAQYIAVRTDVTRRKELEENLQNARDLALQASRLKSEFLANMSHEIRTPMNGVIGMAGLLMDTPLNEDQREIGRLIQSSAENLLKIINDILDFSRIEAGKLRIDPAPFDLRNVVEECLAVLAPRAHQKNLELLCDLDPALPGQLQGDAGRIRQIVTNLVGNAIKFTTEGDVTVRVERLSQGHGRSRIGLSVKDTGIGIAPDVQLQLFQPFTQADGSTTRRFGGTGLGLAISRQLVELMGGSIGFSSELGRGSTFWLELDLAHRVTTSPSVSPLECRARVLVVSPHPGQRSIVSAQLSSLGVIHVAVDDLAEVGPAEATPFDAVLLDQPVGEGGAAPRQRIEQIRTLDWGRTVPLILLTPTMMTPDADLAESLMLHAVITKPVRLGQLGRVLAAIFDGEDLSPAATWIEAELPSSASDAAPPPAGPRYSLLLAEDNPVNQAVAARMLRRLGHAVTVAADGQAALECFGSQRFDAVLMDCQMPKLDGYAATRQIRAGGVRGADARIPVIALTAYALPADRAKCLQAGMNDYVAKPLRLSELEAALQRVLEPLQLFSERRLDDPGQRDLG